MNYKQDKKISITHYKILLTIYELNKANKYPSIKGVNNILSASIDSETIKYKDLKTYGTLLSYSGRKISSCVIYLVRNDYIRFIYKNGSNDKYLILTDDGEDIMNDYQKNHKINLKKKNIIRKDEIVEL